MADDKHHSKLLLDWQDYYSLGTIYLNFSIAAVTLILLAHLYILAKLACNPRQRSLLGRIEQVCNGPGSKPASTLMPKPLPLSSCQTRRI